MANFYGDWVTTGGGKFRLKITASYTDAGIVWTPIIDVNNAFDKKYSATLSYTNHSGTAKTYTKSGVKAVKEYDYSQKTWPNYQIEKAISLKINGKTSKIAAKTIVATNNPPAPTNVSVSVPNNTTHLVNVSVRGSESQPVNKIYVQRATGASIVESDWSDWKSEVIDYLLDGQTDTIQFSDYSVEDDTIYWYRACTSGSKTGTEKKSAYVNASGNPFYSKPSSGDTPQVSEQGVVTWTESNSNIVQKIVTEFRIKRSTNGGSYVQVATVPAVVNQTEYTWRDPNVQPGYSYTYAVERYGTGGSSTSPAEGGTEVIAPPSAPTRVNAYRNSSDDVVVQIDDNSTTAEDVYIERSIDGGNWVQIADENYPCPSYIDEDVIAEDSIVYRVRFHNDAGYSSYTTSNQVAVKEPPLAPTIVSPKGNAIVDIDGGSVRLTFMYRPKDGTPQSAAQVRYRTSGGSWVTQNLTSAYYYELSLVGVSPNTVYEWQARTKGAHADYGDWSEIETFRVMAKPEIVITSPDNGDEISALPVTLTFTYSDRSGTLDSGTITVYDENQDEVQSYDIEPNVYSYPLTHFLFENQKRYSIVVDVQSSSGLNTQSEVGIYIDYVPVSLEGGLLPIVSVDDGNALISIARDITPDDEEIIPQPIEIEEAYLYRLHKRERLLVRKVAEGDLVVDKYAPLNVDYTYELLMLTADGDVSIVSVECSIESGEALIYYGENKVARAKWNPTNDVGLDRPERVQVRYSGRKYPVSYDSDAVEETASFSATIIDFEEVLNFEEMMKKYGTGIWKSLDGDVYDADFSFSHRRDQALVSTVWECSLDVTRIDGGGQ